MAAPVPAPVPAPAPAPVSLPTSAELVLPVAPILGKKTKNILIKHTPKRKLTSIAWKPLKGSKLKGTIFENIKINENNIRLDLELLERLWFKSKNQKKINFFQEKSSSTKNLLNINDNAAREVQVHVLPIILVKYNSIKLMKVINDIKNIENINDIEYVDKITPIVPNEQELNKFKKHPKIIKLRNMNDKDKDKKRKINKLSLAARVWYYCIDIPNVYKRCKLHSLKLEIDEFCPFQEENIKSLQNMYNNLYNNKKINTIIELVLNIGNYLNFGHKTLSNAKGFTLDAIKQMKFCRSNQDGMYSLLTFLVEMVNDNYPELINWVQAFDGIKRIDLKKMQRNIGKMSSKMNRFQQQNTLNQEMQKIWDKSNNNLDSMTDKFNKTSSKCQLLSIYFGETDFNHLCKVLIDINYDWKMTQNLIERSKNIFIALICGFIRKFQKDIILSNNIPSNLVWIIYVYFPRWSLMSISRFIQLNQYKLNQYIRTISNRLPKDNKMFLIKHKPTNKMKLLQWNVIHSDAIDGTIFQNIQQNKSLNIYLDFRLLEVLWKKKPKKNKKKFKKKIEFAVFDKHALDLSRIGFTNRGNNIRVLSAVLFKNNNKGLRDVILNIDNVNDIEYLRKIQRIVPNENEIKRFNDIMDEHKEVEYNENTISKYSLVEQLWFYCKDIPLISRKCELQLLILEINENCLYLEPRMKVIHNIFNKLYNNKDIYKVIELMLFIGNYLNYNHSKLGNVSGFEWNGIFDIFGRFTSCIDPDYTLLMYLIEMINKYYPYLSNWVNIFSDIENMLINKMCIGYDDELIIKSHKFNILLFKNDFNKFDDLFQNKMRDKLQKIDIKLNKLHSDFKDRINECELLYKHFDLGYLEWFKTHVKPDYYEFDYLWSLSVNVKNKWNQIQKLIQKPIKIYDNLVIAYCRRFNKNILKSSTISYQVIQTIYAYLSISFKSHLIKMHQKKLQKLQSVK